MTPCPRCGTHNQAHYRFCLGCGAELPQQGEAATADQAAVDAEAGSVPEAPKSIAPWTADAEQADPAPAATPVADAPTPTSSSVDPDAERPCPACGAMVPHKFRFCSVCGHQFADASPIASSVVPASAAVRARGYLILVLPDGREGERLAIPDDGMRVGRELGGIFAADPYLSPVHAQLAFQGDRVMVEDLASVNGVFVCLPRQVPTALSDGDIFRIGQELVRFEAFSANASTDENDVERMGSPNPGYAGRICLLYGPNEVGNAFCVPAEGLHLGRERGDLLFPEDGYVSGLHCRIQPKDDGAELTDLGSSNGTFLRIQAPTAVAPGGLLLIGQQLFRVEY